MAEQGRREIVNDPLAPNPHNQQAARQLGLDAVRNPRQSGGDAGLQETNRVLGALDNIQGALRGHQKAVNDEDVTRGKMAYLSGVAEADLIEGGNRYTQRGYESLNAVDMANKWYQEELIGLTNGGANIAPEDYQASLMEKRREILKGLPKDPLVQEIYIAAFGDMAPRLSAAHVQANNDVVKAATLTSFGNMIGSMANVSGDAPRVMPGNDLAISPSVVSSPLTSSANDRDIGIRTMLGEAANQGSIGLAGVAWTLRNRQADGRWGGTIAEVALAPKQFSAWNAGVGGNDLVRKYGPGTPQYERAGEVYDAVMSGHTVDPTGGAKDYWSPAGMRALGDADGQPYWAAEKRSQGLVEIVIGGHTFMGNPAAAAIQNTFPSGTQAQLPAIAPPGGGGGAEYEYDANGALIGYDKDGFALPGYTPPTKAAQAPVADRVNAMLDQQGQSEAVAPLAAAQGGSGAGHQTALQEAIRATTGISPQDKVAAVANQVIDTLGVGDASIFNGIGGIAFLHELGATPEQITAVTKAHQSYQTAQDGKFSLETERARQDILSRIDSGDLPDAASVEAAIAELHNTNILSDSGARELLRSAYTDLNELADENGVMQDPRFLNELANAVQNLSTAGADGDLVTATEEILAIAETYGADPKVAETITGRMYSAEMQRRNSITTEAEARLKAQLVENGIKDQAITALSQGYGLSEVTGTIKVSDEQGNVKSVPAKEWAIQHLYETTAGTLPGLTSDDPEVRAGAQFELQRIVYTNLAKQGVVDEKFAAQLHSAMSGNIVGPDGTVKDSALQAFDFYHQMSKNPDVGPEYLSKMFTGYTRSLLETALFLDDGRGKPADAIAKAYEAINNKPANAPEAFAASTAYSEATARQDINAFIETTARNGNSGGFFDWATRGAVFSGSEQAYAQRNTNIAENVIRTEAMRLHLKYPTQPADVTTRMAAQDFVRDARFIGGDMIIGKNGVTVNTDMGLDESDKRAPDMAMDLYLRTHGPTVWQHDGVWDSVTRDEHYIPLPNIPFVQGDNNDEFGRPVAGDKGNHIPVSSNHKGVPLFGITPQDFLTRDAALKKLPPYTVSYSNVTKMFEVTLWTDENRVKMVGQPLVVPASLVGKEYVDHQRAPNTFQWFSDVALEGLADGVETVRTAGDEPNAASAAGAAFGAGIIKP